jgi:hypothetical protein
MTHSSITPKHAFDRYRFSVLAFLAFSWFMSSPIIGRAAAQDEIDGDNFEGFAQAPCDTGLVSNSSTASDYALAMDLCSQSTDDSFKPGLLSAALTDTDGITLPAAQYSIQSAFGDNNAPLFGSRLVVLSTGSPVNVGQAGYQAYEPGFDTETSSAMPADWLSANGGVVPTAPGCPSLSGSVAENPVMLTLRVRVPNNARSFTVNANFFSADYPEYVCSSYNDVFLVLLDSAYTGAFPNPSDKNLAQYFTGDSKPYPLGVNLAFGNTGLFTQCIASSTGCSSGVVGLTNTCQSTSDLVGTGMGLAENICGADNLVGGATGWLAVRGNVVPGETITLRFALWDTSDGASDSLVLLDNFRWSAATITPGTTLP